MWGTPRKIVLTSGAACSITPLNAFDAALLQAGIADFNHIRVSSILPAGAEILSYTNGGRPLIENLTPGSLLPTVYGVTNSVVPGETIAAAIAVGIPAQQPRSGVIFEATLTGTKQAAEDLVRGMAEEGLRLRQISEYEMVLISAEVTVGEGQAGCAICAAIMLPDQQRVYKLVDR